MYIDVQKPTGGNPHRLIAFELDCCVQIVSPPRVTIPVIVASRNRFFGKSKIISTTFGMSPKRD